MEHFRSFPCTWNKKKMTLDLQKFLPNSSMKFSNGLEIICPHLGPGIYALYGPLSVYKTCNFLLTMKMKR